MNAVNVMVHGVGANQYATGGACYDITVPSDGFYISTPATSSSDNVLSSCSTCDPGYEISSACTENSDTVCSAISCGTDEVCFIKCLYTLCIWLWK